MRPLSGELKSRRPQRVKELLRMELPQIIQREVKDPRVRLLTITEIDLKPDMKSAVIYVAKFLEGDGAEPSPQEQAEVIKGLSSASHFIYEQLKKRLSMKVIPSLRFEYDIRLSQLATIWALTSQGGAGMQEGGKG